MSSTWFYSMFVGAPLIITSQRAEENEPQPSTTQDEDDIEYESLSDTDTEEYVFNEV